MPGNSSANCVTSDDDGGIGLCSQIRFPIDAGATTVVVVTSSANGATFSYQANFEAGLLYRGVDPTGIQGLLGVEDGVYNRLAGDCAGVSGIGTSVYYDTVLLTNTTGIPVTFDVITSDQGDPSSCVSVDTFLTVYDPIFVPSNPAANCLTSNDDGGPGTCSAVHFMVEPEKTVVLVVASYGNGASFTYGLNIEGSIRFSDGFESGDTTAWSSTVP